MLNMNPDYFTIDQSKEMGIWPPSNTIGHSVFLYIKRMAIPNIKVLDIGCRKGENAIHLLELDVNNKIDHIYLKSFDKDPKYAEILQKNIANNTKISMFKDDDTKYDVIYIDYSCDNLTEIMNKFYGRLSEKGIFCGNEHSDKKVKNALSQFRRENKITTPISVANGCWFWIKDKKHLVTSEGHNNMNNEVNIFFGTPKKEFVGKYNIDGWGGDDPEGTSLYAQMLFDHIYHALDHVKIDGLYAEFGVFRGRSLKRIANKIFPKKVYGFDSFAGLPESWYCVPKGGFATDIPIFEETNIELVQGLYEDSCPSFKFDGDIAFMHIDCDLYSSTKTVLDVFGDRIVSGTVIVFDEYYNYPGYENHEYKAFSEFLEKFSKKAEPLGVIKANCASPASFIIL